MSNDRAEQERDSWPGRGASVASPAEGAAPDAGDPGAWRALWALVIGFFMILVDSTIVSVATPVLVEGLSASIGQVIWVTSAYLLAYAVPLLITGRLGDKFGPKRVYLAGLAVFTVSSAWCGLTTTASGLVLARVVQGLGAALMTPQTMAVITRLFPPHDRGRAMGLWGAVAGVATLVGPVLGGVLVDSLGWRWIFFINVPVGLLGLALAWRLVPDLPTHSHRFDWLGVVLSAAGLFCLVFGLQEGRAHDWGRIAGPITVWGLIGMGVVLLGVFVGWQAINRAEPLLPLSLLRDRNFSLANTGIALVGFTVTAMPFPLMIWAQAVRGFSPTRAALILAPMAVVTGVLAPRVGRLVDRAHPRVLTSFGFGLFAVTLFGLSRLLTPDSPIVLVLLAFALLGLASSFVWSPLGATATANLPVRMAGAGSGIYNTTRQVGAVVGSAAIAAMMESRLAARIPEEVTGGSAGFPAPGLGPSAGLSEAMADSLLLPAAAIGLGLIVALWFVRPSHQNQVGAPRPDELPVPGRTPSATPAAGSSR